MHFEWSFVGSMAYTRIVLVFSAAINGMSCAHRVASASGSVYWVFVVVEDALVL